MLLGPSGFNWYFLLNIVLTHLGFWCGNFFLIAPFPDNCLILHFYTANLLKTSCCCFFFLHGTTMYGTGQPRYPIVLVLLVYNNIFQ